MCQNVRMDIVLIVPSDVRSTPIHSDISVLMLKFMFFSPLASRRRTRSGVLGQGVIVSQPIPRDNHLGQSSHGGNIMIIPQGNHVWQSSPGNIISHGFPSSLFLLIEALLYPGPLLLSLPTQPWFIQAWTTSEKFFHQPRFCCCAHRKIESLNFTHRTVELCKKPQIFLACWYQYYY